MPDAPGGILFYNAGIGSSGVGMSLLVADDEEKVLSALRLLLEEEPGIGAIDVVGEATSLLAKARETSPDVVLLDWELSGWRDKQLLSELHAQAPLSKVIAMSGRPEARQKAIGSGVDAFVSKSDPPEILLAELHAVLAGKAYRGGNNNMDATKDILQGKWHELSGRVKGQWGKLTDDDVAKLTGKQEELSGLLQQRYGYAKAQADTEINNWLSNAGTEHKA
jgi:DNA-binding NarL/FixJ family response regulator